MQNEKTITIYDKSGRSREVKESLKGAYIGIGKGYFLKDPTLKKEKKES